MMLRYCKSSCTFSHTSWFQKTAKVLNETVQSRWLSLAIEKNARRNVLKPAYFKKTAKKWRWFWKLMNAENIAKRKKKKQNTVARRISWTELFAKTMRFASNVWHMNAKNRQNVGSVSHPAGCLTSGISPFQVTSVAFDPDTPVMFVGLWTH